MVPSLFTVFFRKYKISGWVLHEYGHCRSARPSLTLEEATGNFRT